MKLKQFKEYIQDQLDLAYEFWCGKPLICLREIKTGFKNFWLFKKVIWNYRSWDHSYSLKLYITGLVFLSDSILNDIYHRDGLKLSKEINDYISALERLSNDDYFSSELDSIYKKYPIKTKQVTIKGTEYTQWVSNSKRDRALDIHCKQSKVAKDLDYKFISKLFKKSHRWWT